MSFAEADAKIKTALDGLSAACTPDIRNRETDIPAVVWSLEDSGATETAGGSGGPYHARFQFFCMDSSRILVEDLADALLVKLIDSSDFMTRETSRSGDVLLRGADTKPIYTSTLSTVLTFGS